MLNRDPQRASESLELEGPISQVSSRGLYIAVMVTLFRTAAEGRAALVSRQSRRRCTGIGPPVHRVARNNPLVPSRLARATRHQGDNPQQIF